MSRAKKIVRENPKKKIEIIPIGYIKRYNHNVIKVTNITTDIRPIVLARAISHFLNSEQGAEQILLEDEAVINDIKKKKKSVLKEKAANLIANKYK